jgi:hypothetical protein
MLSLFFASKSQILIWTSVTGRVLLEQTGKWPTLLPAAKVKA